MSTGRHALGLTLATVVTLALSLLGPVAALGQGQPQQQFLLFGTAVDAQDPENPANEVISIDTTGFAFGGAFRKLGVKVNDLRNQLSVKAYFTAGTSCGGGSPRIQLRIDDDGDGVADGNAFGYFGPWPNFVGCPTGIWLFEDLTDGELEWDLTQFGGAFYNTWAQVEAFFAAFPNHEVLSGALVDDTFPGSPRGQGVVHYDLVTVGNNTIDGHSDTAP